MSSQRLTTLEFQGSRSDRGASVRGLAAEGTSTESRLCGATTRPTGLVRGTGGPGRVPSHTQKPKRRRHRRSRNTYKTRPQCWWARAGREPHAATKAPQAQKEPRRLQNTTAVLMGQGGARATRSNQSAAGTEGAETPTKHGNSTGGRRRGHGGPRDRPLRAMHACGDLAGGLTPNGTHSGPANRIGNSVTRHQGHPRYPKHLRGMTLTHRPTVTPAHRHTVTPSHRHTVTPAPEHGNGAQTQRSRPTPRGGSGGSCAGPLGGLQQRFQRIWVPVAPRRSQASTTRAAMPASADLPHVRGSYCFLMPTSPSILRTPS